MPSTAELVDRARSGIGPLDSERRALLQAVIDNPSTDNWRSGRSLIINESGFVTLWQAVSRVDPLCPTEDQLDPEYVPTKFTVRRALARALSGEVTQ